LRIGYGVAKPEIVALMNKVRQPFNTNTLGQIGALAALSDRKHVEKSVTVNNEGKQLLYREFERLDVKYTPTETNFILFETVRDGKDLYDALLRKGVIVRPMGGSRIRVTIGVPEENQRFVAALEEVLKA
jgi:histidinol-phosphate aminotransferase